MVPTLVLTLVSGVGLLDSAVDSKHRPEATIKNPFNLEIASWRDFTDRVSDFQGNDDPLNSQYIYRGHWNDKWELLPSLTRYVEKVKPSQKRLLSIERNALREFQKHAHLFLPASNLHHPDMVSSWWVLMQHHGSPTRILDWTLSPYVALYFAVEREPDTDAAVWVVHIKSVYDYMSRTFGSTAPPDIDDERSSYMIPTEEDRLYILTPKTQTDRMGAQQTAFTISTNILANHGTILSKAIPASSGMHQFTKFLIPRKLKQEFKRRLREMNISARALFPGIDGLGRATAELIDIACYWTAEATKQEE